MTRSTMFALAVVLSSVAVAGCGAEDPEGPALDDVEDVTTTQSALVTGCASLKVTKEAHTGALIGYGTPTVEMAVPQVKFWVKNPSTVNCTYAQIRFDLTNDLTGRKLVSHTFEVAITAGQTWVFTWNTKFDSRTYTPKVDYQEDVWMYANGRLLKATYLPSYFYDLGQY